MSPEIRTVMLADLTNYIQLWNRIGAERAIAELNEALKVAGDIILANNGQIVKYVGDAILASFPSQNEGRTAAHQLRRQYDKRIDGQPLLFRIILVTGEAFAVKVGHPSLIQDDLMGDALNMAFKHLGDAKSTPDGIVEIDLGNPSA